MEKKTKLKSLFGKKFHENEAVGWRKNPVVVLETLSRSGTSHHILTCQSRFKKNYTLKNLKDVQASIGSKIDTFNTKPAVNQNFFGKAELRQVTVTASSTQTKDLSVKFFRWQHFTSQCLRNLFTFWPHCWNSKKLWPFKTLSLIFRTQKLPNTYKMSRRNYFQLFKLHY